MTESATATSVVELLKEYGPAVIADHARLRNRCILATRIGYDVLRYFGVPAEPLVVDVLIFNPTAVEWIEAGRALKGEEARAAGCWVIRADRTVEGPGFAGHVVLDLGEAVLDLDLQQFQRPEKQIRLPEAALFERGALNVWDYRVAGSHVLYSPRPEDRSYRRAPDWRRRSRAAPARLIRKIRERLDSGH